MKKNRNALKRFISLFLLISLFVSLGSCARAPLYHPESYEELKNDFAGYPQFKFPDLSEFDNFGFGYQVVYAPRSGFGCTQAIGRLTNYNIGGDINSDSVLSGPGFIRVSFSGKESLTFYEETENNRGLDELEKNSHRGFNPNMEYRGIAIERWGSEQDIESYEYYHDMYGSSIPFPDSFMYHYSFLFEMDEVVYSIYAVIVIPSGEVGDPALKEELTLGEQKLFSLIDSVIDQANN